MSEIILYVQCEEYLRQWIIHASGGITPVRLRKGSPEAFFLEAFLQRKSQKIPDQRPDQDSLAICIPSFRHKPPESFNRLSETSRKAFLRIFRSRFDYQIWNDLCNIESSFSRKDELIAAWMEANGIDDTEKNTLAVTKRLQRLRDRVRAKERMKKSRKKL